MRRRVVGVVALSAATLVLAGCPATPPPPPPGWTEPVVTMTVSPDPVQAGEPFTVEVDAVHNDPISDIGLRIQPPIAQHLNPMFSEVGCEGEPYSPAAIATRSFVCRVPALAPNGDDWVLTANAFSSSAPPHGASLRSTFSVTGGSDDRSAPRLVSTLISPDPVVIGQPFTVTVRSADDNHLPPSPTRLTAGFMVPAPPAGQVNWTCAETTPTEIDATTLEWRFTDCLIPIGSSPFKYGANFQLADTLGYKAYMSVLVHAVSG